MFRVKRRTVITTTAVAAGLLAVALVVTLLTQGKDDAGPANVMEYTAGQGPLVPDFTGTSLTGAAIKLSDYRGKVVVLNFWGSWCPPCRAEAPTLAFTARQYKSAGVAFLGDDVGDTPANALAFTRSVGTSYPSINDPGYAVTLLASKAQLISFTPTTWVIDKSGHLFATIIGIAAYGELTTLLRDAGVP